MFLGLVQSQGRPMLAVGSLVLLPICNLALQHRLIVEYLKLTIHVLYISICYRFTHYDTRLNLLSLW